MGYQIDQSGKIEDTARASIIGLSNSTQATISISAKEKRRLQEYFRHIGAPRLFVELTFSAFIYLLIQNITKLVIIDNEYPGHNKNIERNLNCFAKRELLIQWKLIGKNSPAHDLAYKTLIRKLPPTKTITALTLWKLITKKAGGRLNDGLSPANRRSDPANNQILPKKRKMSR